MVDFVEIYNNPWFRSLIGLVFVGLIFLFGMIAVWMERKIAGDIQHRIGPNRVGKFGVLQLVADAIKLFTKEDIIPIKADRVLFVAAPMVMLGSVFLMLAAIPFGAVVINDTVYPIVAAEMDISLLYIQAMSSISLVGIFMAAYGSNNKYSLIGAFRNFARMVGYEVPLIISVISVAIMANSLDIIEIVKIQDPIWYIVLQPIGFIVFFVASMSEMGRLPFDQTEAEEELVAGWVTEYSGMRFGLGFFAEYMHVVLGSFLISLLFLGGWNIPGFIPGALTANPVLGFIVPTAVLLGKAAVVMIFILMFRWAVPRFRIDQVVDLSWKKLFPLSVLNLVWVIAFTLYMGV